MGELPGWEKGRSQPRLEQEFSLEFVERYERIMAEFEAMQKELRELGDTHSEV